MPSRLLPRGGMRLCAAEAMAAVEEGGKVRRGWAPGEGGHPPPRWSAGAPRLSFGWQRSAAGCRTCSGSSSPGDLPALLADGELLMSLADTAADVGAPYVGRLPSRKFRRCDGVPPAGRAGEILQEVVSGRSARPVGCEGSGRWRRGLGTEAAAAIGRDGEIGIRLRCRRGRREMQVVERDA